MTTPTNLSETKALQPCPHCGDVLPRIISVSDAAIAECSKCGATAGVARLPKCREGETVQQYAARRWNRRAPATPAPRSNETGTTLVASPPPRSNETGEALEPAAIPPTGTTPAAIPDDAAKRNSDVDVERLREDSDLADHLRRVAALLAVPMPDLPPEPAKVSQKEANHSVTLCHADDNAVSLRDCPSGFFLVNGMVGFKDGYGGVYCDSGEYFWGGTDDENVRDATPVMPLAVVPAPPPSAAERTGEVEPNGCPCCYGSPCSDACTCANPVMSGGCTRCCRYGNASQREAAARRLKTLEGQVAEAGRLLKVHHDIAIEADEHGGGYCNSSLHSSTGYILATIGKGVGDRNPWVELGNVLAERDAAIERAEQHRLAHNAAEARRDADVRTLARENATLRGLLRRYRTETPLGHQPHMIAHEVDAALNTEKP